MQIAGLFAGIGGLEKGFEESGHETLLFCEIDPCAQAVLKARFEDIPLVGDVRHLEDLPAGTEVVTAGFPCQDLSQAGTTRGINGTNSGVVEHLFRLLEKRDVPHVVVENVPFMLQLDRGQAIRYLVDKLEEPGYSWAYRVVDANAFGLPQRRERVFLIASKVHEPWHSLMKASVERPQQEFKPGVAYGFYWTEGTRGLGWAVDAVPTLKGGSTIGIPSPPAIWLPDGRIVKPDITDAERLQGFTENWTKPSEEIAKPGYRWRLVGNAVSVRASAWLGRCLNEISHADPLQRMPVPLAEDRSWPAAAYGSRKHGRSAVRITKWPCKSEPIDLSGFLSSHVQDLSLKAVSGFLNRLTSSSLRYPDEFLQALRAHQMRMAENGNGLNGRR